MNKLILLFIPFILFACQSSEEKPKNVPTDKTTSLSQAEAEKIAEDLVQGAFDDIWSAMDSAKIWKYHTDDFIICENGMVWNNDSIVSYQNRVKANGTLPVRENSFKFFKVEHTNEVIWMAYHNFATITNEGKNPDNYSWLESAVAIKENDAWKIQVMHSTYNGNRYR